jgi:hypothetical protein
MNRVVLIILLASSLAACSKQEPCDPEKVAAFFTLPKDNALGGARSICKYPPALQTMLDNLDMASPDQRAALVAKAISQDISHFQRVCPRAAGVMRVVAEVSAKQKNYMLDQGCGLERLKLASRTEILHADVDRLLVAIMVYGWMKEEKVPQAHKICRRIMGLW